MKRVMLCDKRIFALSLVLLVLVLQLPALAQEGRIEEIQVYSQGLEGNLLGDSTIRNVTVYLPPGYGTKPDKRYPVVYLLHGYTGKNTLWTGGGYVKDLNIAAIADRLIASGDVQPMILVAPDCQNEYRGSWYTNSPVTGNWEDFVTKDLIRNIDSKYRTIRKGTSRAIVGHSMGGYGAIKIAMKHPEIYCAVYAMAPAGVDFNDIIKEPPPAPLLEAARTTTRDGFKEIDWRSQALIALAAAVAPNPESEPFFGELPIDANGNRMISAGEKWLEHDLSTRTLATYGDNLRKYEAVAIDCGADDDLLPTICTFIRALEKAGIKHTFEEFNGNHINRVASQLEQRVLPLFSKTLKPDQSAAAVPVR